MPKEAVSLDLDGVVIGRIPFQYSAVRRLFSRPPIDFSPPPLTELDRGVRYEEPNLRTRLNLFRHSIAPVTRQAKQVIPQLSQFADVYANSGRVNTSAWNEKANTTLEKAGIRKHFKGVFFKPPGSRGIVSKIAAIAELRERYRKVTHVDDNPQDALPIAKAFPDVDVVILQDLSTGLLVSMKELREYPNVRRVTRLRNAFPQTAQSKNNPSTSETRNSKLREISASPIQEITGRLHKILPGLQPDHITFLGAIGTAMGSAMATRENMGASSFSILSTSSLLDAFDGALARTIEKESPGTIDFKKGAVLDSLSDRSQELFMALSRAISANRRNDTLGKIAALLNAVSNSLPSTAKAYAETKGIAVPESGTGPLGIFGTRVGRTPIEVAVTAFPEIKSAPAQLIADTLVTIANVTTAIDRIQRSRGNSPSLSQQDRDDAKTRFKALALFTGIALGATVTAYMKLKNHETRSQTQQPELESEGEQYLQIISDIENYCQENSLDHRFVGGTITDLIGPETEFQIDVTERRIKLIGANKPTMIRPDGSVKDMDLVVFTKNLDDFLRAKAAFDQKGKQAKAQGKPFPQISVEAAYQPDWPKRNKLKQFVSAFETNSAGNLFLAFGEISQEIPSASVEPWTIDIDGRNRITAFNPIAHYLCYEFRVPSGVKPKDLDKLSFLEEPAFETTFAGRELEIDYEQMYASWNAYIEKLRNHPDTLTRVKGRITDIWWKTLGTAVTHGKGPLGALSRFNNKMNG